MLSTDSVAEWPHHLARAMELFRNQFDQISRIGILRVFIASAPSVTACEAPLGFSADFQLVASRHNPLLGTPTCSTRQLAPASQQLYSSSHLMKDAVEKGRSILCLSLGNLRPSARLDHHTISHPSFLYPNNSETTQQKQANCDRASQPETRSQASLLTYTPPSSTYASFRAVSLRKLSSPSKGQLISSLLKHCSFQRQPSGLPVPSYISLWKRLSNEF